GGRGRATRRGSAFGLAWPVRYRGALVSRGPSERAGAHRSALRSRSVAAAAVAYAALAIRLAWPLPLHLATALVDPMATGEAGAPAARADLDLNVWILAWDAHALARGGRALFQAN